METSRPAARWTPAATRSAAFCSTGRTSACSVSCRRRAATGARQFRPEPPPAIDEQPVREGLQRAETCRWHHQHRSSDDRADRRAVLRRDVAHVRVPLGGAAARRSARADSLADNARNLALISVATADSLVASLGDQVSLSVLAAGDGDSRRRHRRQPEDRSGCRLHAVHHDAVLPELSVEPRERQQRRHRDAPALLRGRRPRHHLVGDDPGPGAGDVQTTRRWSRSRTTSTTRASTAASTSVSIRSRAFASAARWPPPSSSTTCGKTH